jgi:hypothetical protein
MEHAEVMISKLLATKVTNRDEQQSDKFGKKHLNNATVNSP